MENLTALTAEIDRFALEREWDQFHSPKNLSMALVVEAAELVEEFQWLTERESLDFSEGKKDKVADEIGDVLIYTLRLCSRLGLDPLRCAGEKLRKNAEKYPIALSKGKATKYSDLK